MSAIPQEAMNGAAELSKVSCLADRNVSHLVLGVLEDLAIPEIYIQRAKQLVLEDKRRAFGFGAGTALAEDRADFVRFYVPRKYEAGVVRRIADAADLYLPGRGSIYAEDALVSRSDGPAFDDGLLGLLSAESKARDERHTVLCCIVQRGMADMLARSMLDMGLCVPIVSFGEGMGLRNKLGLLRITIPVDKEVMYFIVPERDADLVEGVAVHKARLDRPGQGFIYRYPVRALAVNLRVRRGKRSSAASMEQVIAALDELRGSSDWRRVAPSRKARPRAEHALSDFACLSLIAEEGTVGDFVRAAMDAGAGGATLVPLEYHSFSAAAARSSHARETCDLIVARSIVPAVMEAVKERGLFTSGIHGIAEVTNVEKAVTYTG